MLLQKEGQARALSGSHEPDEMVVCLVAAADPAAAVGSNRAAQRT